MSGSAFFADAARVALPRQDGSEFLHGKPVATGTFFLAMLGIRSPSASPTGVDKLVAARPVRAPIGEPHPLIFRVLCKLLGPSRAGASWAAGP